jgi:hypothetical protein
MKLTPFLLFDGHCADPDLLDDLRDLPFGTYGHLADRYGVHWFFQGDSAGQPG